MPSGRGPLRSSFVEAARIVRKWLRETCGDRVRSLTPGELAPYNLFGFAKGWNVEVEVAGVVHDLHFLLPPEFPFARPRVSLARPDHTFAQPDLAFVWPHVEDHGVMCLPADPILPDDPAEMSRAALDAACKLIEVNLGGIDDQEFRREFISYWNRTVAIDERQVRSLLTPSGPSRKVAVWHETNYDLVGETTEQLERWLKHVAANRPQEGFSFYPGVLAWLQRPPAPAEFPRTVAGLREFLRTFAPDAVPILEAMLPGQKTAIIVLAAETETGVGLAATALAGQRNPRVNGFRKGYEPRELALNAWFSKASFARRHIDRLNASWIHGREHDPAHQILREKKVALLGCGALGSHIAVRLAQAGVGSLTLVDPELVEAANVGRHVLGVTSVGKPKADQLAAHLGLRFPHLRSIRPLRGRWERLSAADWSLVEESDLIVSTIGDWSAEGPLNEWHRRAAPRPPIVYGWLEEFAVAGHALLIADQPSCFRCIVDENGRIRKPETEPPAGHTLTSEPACGGAFQPFGPVDLAYAEAMVAELCLDVLLGRRDKNCLRTYATSTEQLKRVGSTWTKEHLARRPPGFDGHFVDERPAPDDPACKACKPHE